MEKLLILGLDTATTACSVALLGDDHLIAEFTLNIKKTHSERLMPLVDCLLEETGFNREELNALAVSSGPGSFTGLRIGLATTRGLAQGLGIPAVGVGTLEAMAEMIPIPGALICPLLDARRNQVYSALFRFPSQGRGNLESILEPGAWELEELLKHISEMPEPVTYIGEGISVYRPVIENKLPAERVIIPERPFHLCRAALVAVCASRLLQGEGDYSYHNLLPRYLRKPEAERLYEERREQ